MEYLFIDPGVLPGGKKWKEVCGNATKGSDLWNNANCDTPAFLGALQVIFLLCIYGYVIYKAADMISGGSELLLFIDRLKNIVGSVILPLLGAVPDGAIVLFSGLGANAQEKISVGVGALAGSNILLLTIPWFSAILAGRVNIIPPNRTASYFRRPAFKPPTENVILNNLFNTGVVATRPIRYSGRFMLLTSISYIFILLSLGPKSVSEFTNARIAAIVILMICIIFLFRYVLNQMMGKYGFDERIDEIWKMLVEREIYKKSYSVSDAYKGFESLKKKEGYGSVSFSDEDRKLLSEVLKGFFEKYDRNSNNHMDHNELFSLMHDLGENMTEEEVKGLKRNMDTDEDGQVSFKEFCDALPDFIEKRWRRKDTPEGENEHHSLLVEGGGDEEHEIPEDLRHEDPRQLEKNILRRALRMMSIGSMLILLFSDPAVGVMQDLADRLNISSFYVSFALAPMASNFVEVLAAYTFAKKKTQGTITVSLTNLLGAAIMNNTFVLSIFLGLILMKGLVWTFTVETLAILGVQIFVGILSQTRMYTLMSGIIILSFYPLSIIFIYYFKK